MPIDNAVIVDGAPGNLVNSDRTVNDLTGIDGTGSEVRERNGTINDLGARDRIIRELGPGNTGCGQFTGINTAGEFRRGNGTIRDLGVGDGAIGDLSTAHGAVGEFGGRNRSIGELRGVDRSVGDHGVGDGAAGDGLGDLGAEGEGGRHDLLTGRHLRVDRARAIVHRHAEETVAASEGIGDGGNPGGVGFAAHGRTRPDEDAEFAPGNGDGLLLGEKPVDCEVSRGVVPNPEGHGAGGGDPVARGIDDFTAVANERRHLRLSPRGRGEGGDRESEGEEGSFHRKRRCRGGTVGSGHGREGGRGGGFN